MLDSGAYSFIQNNAKIDWDAYLEEYAAFINENKVELFIELDIDAIVGIKEVERYRARLEALTGKQPIVVWHKNRGLAYYKQMCKEYPYVAHGSALIEGIPTAKLEQTFPWFIDTAHENGAKIHALGYTSIKGLHTYHFDSVDSTAWLYGNRGGFLVRFNPTKGDFDKVQAPAGFRLRSRDAALYNYREWQKFQQYAKKYL